MAKGIDNPEAIRFVNEQVRPLCEKLRAVFAEIDSMQISWQGRLSVMFPGDETLVDDGREGEGVSHLTGSDIQQVMSIVANVAGEKNVQILAKPCVRTFSAQ